MEILDHYVLAQPGAQNALDIFRGEWSSRLPDSLGLRTEPGSARLFEDARIDWAEERLGSFEGKSILELGPLEAGHSYMLQRRGARRVLAIEANTRCYLKCLCVKEALGLDRVEFLLGDFVSYLEGTTDRFDVTIACGVLYHMKDPVGLLKRIATVSHKAFIWTHYFDPAVIAGNAVLAPRFSPVHSLQQDGHSYEYAVQTYQAERNTASFCGGATPVSHWLTLDSLVRALQNYGFKGIEVGFHDPHHVHGPAVAICVTR